MTSRTSLRSAALLVVALVGLSACSTFTDNGVAARIGASELTHDELGEIIDAEPTVASDSAQAMRNLAGQFLAGEALKAELGLLGLPVTSVDDPDLPLDQRLAQEFETNRLAWLGVANDQLRDAETQALYEGDESPVICAAHVLTDTRDEALAAIAALADGESFADVAAARSIDQGSAASGGQLGCRPVDDFVSAFIPEFVDGTLPLSADEVSEPIESQFGFHVITKVPFTELDASGLIPLRVGLFDERYDIYVDPQIGRWDDAGLIVPLG